MNKFLSICLLLSFDLSAQVVQQKINPTRVLGRVSFIRPPDNARRTVRIGTVLKEKDVIYTEAAANVDLTFEDGTRVTIGENSLVALTDLNQSGDQTTTKFTLKLGKVLFDIKRTIKKGSLFEFETGSLTAGVRGTKGGVGSWKSKSLAYLEKGEMTLASGSEGVPGVISALELVVQTEFGFETIKTETVPELLEAVAMAEGDMQGTEQPVDIPGESEIQSAEPQPEDSLPAADTAARVSEDSPEAGPAMSSEEPAASDTAGAAEAAGEPGDPGAEGDKKADEGFSFTPGLSMGTMTKNGNTWTRFSFRPEISLGKLGVAFDLEMFMNERQKLDAFGWEFDTYENGKASILRKIYYVRWGHPGDNLYLKAGSIEGVTLGYGLLMNGYGNVGLYPEKKPIGFHGEIGDPDMMGLKIEAVFNNIDEALQAEAVMGTRFSVAPLASLGLPLISQFRVGLSAIADRNQYKGLDDVDEDNCPDVFDDEDGNPGVCKKTLIDYNESFTGSTLDTDALAAEAIAARDADILNSAKIQNQVRDGDQFSVMGLDAGVPIVNMKLFSLTTYSELGFQLYRQGDNLIDGGFGLILPGIKSKIGPVSARAEYRYFKMPFNYGHFDAIYEMERATTRGKKIITKEEKYWSDLEEIYQGIYGEADVDLMGLFVVGGSYEHMSPETGPARKGYSGHISLGRSIANLIPKVSSGSLFWRKSRVGEDLNPEGDDGSKDSFYDRSIYTYYGYSVGIQMNANMIITMKNISSFFRDTRNRLQRQTNLVLETAITF